MMTATEQAMIEANQKIMQGRRLVAEGEKELAKLKADQRAVDAMCRGTKPREE